jgi:hypothetical protein
MDSEIELPKIAIPKFDQNETINLISGIIAKYNQNGNLVLEKIEDLYNFADIKVEISAKPDLHFYIFRDHFQAVAAFEIKGKTLRIDLDDLLNILEIQFEPVPLDTDIVEATERFMKIITNSLPKLQDLFNKQNRNKNIKILQKSLYERRVKYIRNNFPYIDIKQI